MLPRTGNSVFGESARTDRFDADTVRRILGRAAAEQHRIDVEKREGYTREELEEMADEAGISREALIAAIGEPGARQAWWRRWFPAHWSSARSGLVVAALLTVLLVAVMIAFPVVAWAVLWAAIVFGILVLLGATPL